MEPGRITKVALALAVCVTAAVVLLNLYSGYRKLQQASLHPRPAPVTLEHLDRPAPDFSLTDQNGNNTSLAGLRGKVWAASFIFTHCQGPCPLITRHMAELQARIADLPDARLVSLTLDPARDTPAVLKNYAAGYQADGQRWFFLTGPEGEMKRIIQEGFLTAMQPVEGSDQIIHGTWIALVDHRGVIRGFLSATDPGVVEKAAVRLRELHAAR